VDLEIIFITAILLEVAFCAIPGAITAEALRRGVGRGYRPALMVQIGSIVGDTTWMVVALVGLAFLVENAAIKLGIGLIGCLFLIYLAWSAFAEARQGRLPEPTEGLERGDFMTGVLLSLGNPFQVAFWLGIGGTTIAAMAPDPQPIHYAVFFTGFMIAAVGWCFFFAWVVAKGRRFVNVRTFQVIEVVCGLFLGYLGISMLWSTLVSVGVLH
jgi:chemosensory pili system protein ChpE